MPGTKIVQRDTISAIIQHRNRALTLAEQGIELLRKADEAYRSASLDGSIGLWRGMSHSDWYTFDSDNSYRDRRKDDLMEKLRSNVDQTCWRRLITLSGITNLMDAQLEAELRKQLRDAPPEVNENAMIATLEDLYSRRDQTFRQAIVNLFSRLSLGYASHSAFSIGRRLILKNCVSHYGHSLHQSARDELSDLDRMSHIVLGFTPPNKDNDLGSSVQQSVTNRMNEVRTQFFKVRIFPGNGNLHIYIEDPQLIRKLNDIIAKYHGETLPAGK